MIYVSVGCQHHHQHRTALGKGAHLGRESGNFIHDLCARKGLLNLKMCLMARIICISPETPI